MRTLSKKPAVGAGGGLSKAQQVLLESLEKSTGKLEQQMRLVQSSIRNMNIDEVKAGLKTLPDKASKLALDSLTFQSLNEIKEIKELVS